VPSTATLTFAMAQGYQKMAVAKSRNRRARISRIEPLNLF
jgi:hypothetical protein